MASDTTSSNTNTMMNTDNQEQELEGTHAFSAAADTAGLARMCIGTQAIQSATASADDVADNENEVSFFEPSGGEGGEADQ